MGFFSDLKEGMKEYFNGFKPKDSPIAWDLKEKQTLTCPKCGKMVTGQRKIGKEEGYGGTTYWSSNEKCGEIKDQYGNKADIYHKVNHSQDDSYIISEYWYECHCNYCGNEWETEKKRQKH